MKIDFTKFAFIFDMDGTLVDNMRFHTKAWMTMLAENGVVADEEEFLVKTAGKTSREIIPDFVKDATEEELLALADRKQELYREFFKAELKTIDGVNEFLGESQELGIKMAVATASPIVNMEFILDGLDLRKYFSAIVTSADVEKGKPHPEGFLISAEKLGVEPQRCLVFEDAINGFEAAHRANMKSIGISTVNSIEEISYLKGVVDAGENFVGMKPADLIENHFSRSAVANW